MSRLVTGTDQWDNLSSTWMEFIWCIYIVLYEIILELKCYVSLWKFDILLYCREFQVLFKDVSGKKLFFSYKKVFSYSAGLSQLSISVKLLKPSSSMILWWIIRYIAVDNYCIFYRYLYWFTRDIWRSLCTYCMVYRGIPSTEHGSKQITDDGLCNTSHRWWNASSDGNNGRLHHIKRSKNTFVSVHIASCFPHIKRLLMFKLNLKMLYTILD